MTIAAACENHRISRLCADIKIGAWEKLASLHLSPVLFCDHTSLWGQKLTDIILGLNQKISVFCIYLKPGYSAALIYSGNRNTEKLS